MLVGVGGLEREPRIQADSVRPGVGAVRPVLSALVEAGGGVSLPRASDVWDVPRSRWGIALG